MKSFGNGPPPSEGIGNGRQSGNFGLVRQPSSVYSLTFGEFQSSLGKEFGSMNMDELLKNIWTAEESQSMGLAVAPSGAKDGGNLQKQGSLTLPRTMSQKTVDEVWRGLMNDTGSGGASMPPGTQRQPTLGEITLEEFLVRAGVVREDEQTVECNPGGFLGEVVRDDDNNNNNNNASFRIDFQHPSRSLGLMGNYAGNNGGQIFLQPPNLPTNVNGVSSSQQQQQRITPQMPQQQQQQQAHQQHIYPKQFASAYAPRLAMPGTTQVGIPGIRGGLVGLANPTINGTLAQVSPMLGGGMGAAAGYPFPFDGLAKSNGDTASISPVPYMLNGGLRVRKGNGVEKVIERRQKRMIKNRESAARSRSRKQVHNMELEEEIKKLQEENEELKLKQAQILKMQKNEALEMMEAQNISNSKKRCLRRTQTGPW